MKILVLTLAALAGLALIGPLSAAPTVARIELPDGWQPEGIATGPGNSFYVGSIPTGAVYRGNVKTGEGAVLVPAQPGRNAVGLSLDSRGRLFVAGGNTGDGYVYDAETGANIAAYDFAAAPTFVNDVVVTQDSAWFTDSLNPVLYRVPIAADGTLGTAETLPLTGDFTQVPGFNLNGIDATPNGKLLIAVQSVTGRLFAIDPETGDTDEIELAGGELVPNGDGILLDGKTLYVVQNRLNLVAKIALAADYRSGTVVSRTGNADFDVPTTVAEKGNRLLLVNARFGTTDPQPARYWITTMVKP